MPEPPEAPAQPKEAAAGPPAEAAPPGAMPQALPQAPPAPPAVDSATFTRCARCRYAEAVNSAAGTLLCRKHNMLINAEADEIPDDCIEHEPVDDEFGA
jgi:hypothetical protein